MKIGLSTMTKNQGNRLKEWVEYHNNLGIDKFIIFLDGCTDNSKKILESLNTIDITIFETHSFGGDTMDIYWEHRSHRMYNYVLKNYSDLDWIAFIEVDEFIFPQIDEFDIKMYLEKLDTKCLYVNSWDLKGPFKEDEPILGQSYEIWTDHQRYNSNYKWRGKSIIKPKEFSECVDAHHFKQKNGSISTEFKVPHKNFIQKNYGKEVTIDDEVIRIYHSKNHITNMNDTKIINY